MFGIPLKSTIPEWLASQTMRSNIVDGLESVQPEHEEDEELLVVKTALNWNSEKLAGSKANTHTHSVPIDFTQSFSYGS